MKADLFHRWICWKEMWSFKWKSVIDWTSASPLGEETRTSQKYCTLCSCVLWGASLVRRLVNQTGTSHVLLQVISTSSFLEPLTICSRLSHYCGKPTLCGLPPNPPGKTRQCLISWAFWMSSFSTLEASCALKNERFGVYSGLPQMQLRNTNEIAAQEVKFDHEG